MTTHFLCKMAPTGGPITRPSKFVAVIGRVVECERGYRFLPNTSSHKASRNFHRTAQACIPKWTERCAFLQLLGEDELRDARVSA